MLYTMIKELKKLMKELDLEFQTKLSDNFILIGREVKSLKNDLKSTEKKVGLLSNIREPKPTE